jgi:hypothetical protein
VFRDTVVFRDAVDVEIEDFWGYTLNLRKAGFLVRLALGNCQNVGITVGMAA